MFVISTRVACSALSIRTVSASAFAFSASALAFSALALASRTVARRVRTAMSKPTRPPPSTKLSISLNCIRLLFYTYLFEPRSDIERWAGFCRQIAMSYDTDFRVSAVEIQNIGFERITLRLCSAVFGLHLFVATAHIHNVATYAIGARCTVGYLPRINPSILVVLDKTLDTAVKVEHIGISDLLPASAALRRRSGMPRPNIRRGYLPTLGRGSTVNNKLSKLLFHSLRLCRSTDDCTECLLFERHTDRAQLKVHKVTVIDRIVLCLRGVGGYRTTRTHNTRGVECYRSLRH